MTSTLAETDRSPGPLVPDVYRVAGRRREADDVVTLSLEPTRGGPPAFRAGQFNMLTAFGVGEVPISMSSQPGAEGPLEHTVRDVGAVTHALCAAEVGSVVGVRGPFGTDWGIERLSPLGATDVVVVAGGIGLAPLRGAIRQLAGAAPARPAGGGTPAVPSGRLVVLVGARSPDQLLFADDLARWRALGVDVGVTVDQADASWSGHVGVVTTLVTSERFDPARTIALICGPEVMMRFTARALLDRGVDPTRIVVSMERNMQCGIGICGHCQLGPLLLCRDGPVAPYAGTVSKLMTQRER